MGRYKTGAWITAEKLFNLEVLCAHTLPIKCIFPVLYAMLWCPFTDCFMHTIKKILMILKRHTQDSEHKANIDKFHQKYNHPEGCNSDEASA